MRNILSFILEITKIVIIALIIVIPIRYFIFQPFFVKGESMEPNFRNGDYLIIDEISYRFRNPRRGEVVVFKYPRNPSQKYIKRIIGLPGETIKIKDSKVIISNSIASQILDESAYLPPDTITPGDLRVTLAEDEYFVLGDNRTTSADSRNFGPLSRKYIIGRVVLRTWPFNALAQFKAPKYLYE